MKPKRSRTVRRELERDVEKLWEARRKLAALERGGDASRPIDVPSASVIETRAVTFPCLRCDGELRVHEHRARRDVREVELRCKACGTPRTLWFAVAMPS